MARPLIPVDVIYHRALELLDAEGAEGLSARRLASDLKISTRTLYQQVGNREQLIRALVSRHMEALTFDLPAAAPGGDWERAAFDWCTALYETLRRHPHLTELMTLEDRRAVVPFARRLVAVMVDAGVVPSLAASCCRTLTTVTINHVVVEVRSLRETPTTREESNEIAKIAANFPRTVRLIIAGARAELLQANAAQ